MNLVDALLNADTNAILAEKTKEYEVERLSKACKRRSKPS